MVLVNGKLVAILVHLTGSYNTPGLQGKWFVEVGFGPLSEKHELFSTIEEAEDWVLQHYFAERKRGSGQTLQGHAPPRLDPVQHEVVLDGGPELVAHHRGYYSGRVER